jgi:hypothetical protein
MFLINHTPTLKYQASHRKANEQLMGIQNFYKMKNWYHGVSATDQLLIILRQILEREEHGNKEPLSQYLSFVISQQHCVENNTANHILKGLLGIIHAAMLDPGV